jgi:glutathione S-transferase
MQASPDTKSLGDCPFTQRANLAFKVKKVPVTYVLIDLSNKPKWYSTVNPAGTVPTLEFGDRKITDSADILEYVDATYPSPSLKPDGNQEAEEVIKNVFGIFVAWVKQHDDPTAAEAEAKLTADLEKIDNFLGKYDGPLLCGKQWSMADCTFAPRIYHITTVASHYLGYTKYKDMPNLNRYMEYVYSSEEFKATDYPAEYIPTGWAKYFK